MHWRGGSTVKSTCCASRGPRFGFQHPPGGPELSGAPVPWSLMSLSGPCRHQAGMDVDITVGNPPTHTQRVLTALPEDLSSVPSTHIGWLTTPCSCDSSASVDLIPLAFLSTCPCIWYIPTQLICHQITGVILALKKRKIYNDYSSKYFEIVSERMIWKSSGYKIKT